MSIAVFQLLKSEIIRPIETATGTTYWMAVSSDGTGDDSALATAVDSALPSTYLGTSLQDWKAEYHGNGVWTIIASYGELPPLAIGTTIWETDQMGGSEKIYQSYKTTGTQRAVTGDPIIDYGGGIGVTDDGVEGTDIHGSEIKWTAKRRYVHTALAADYLKNLEKLRRKTNAASFSFTWQSVTYTYAIGEALFLGFRASEVSSTRVEIDYAFAMSRDVTGVSVQGFDATVSKKAWDYGWFSYVKETSNGKTVKKPVQFNTEQVYLKGDFSILSL